MNHSNVFKFPMHNYLFMPAHDSVEDITRRRVTAQMQAITMNDELNQHDALELYRDKAADACLEHVTTLTNLGEKATIMRISHYLKVCKYKICD